MIDIAIGLLQIGFLLIMAVACYFASELVRDLKDARDYTRQQAEADRYRSGDWP